MDETESDQAVGSPQAKSTLQDIENGNETEIISETLSENAGKLPLHDMPNSPHYNLPPNKWSIRCLYISKGGERGGLKFVRVGDPTLDENF